jgi:uncharacterized protein (TIGR03083 family)
MMDPSRRLASPAATTEELDVPEPLTPNPSQLLDVLAGSHDRLTDRVSDLSGLGLRTGSYCADWTVAQVLSHLGSGAEIFRSYIDAVEAGHEPPSTDTFPAIWERWNAMTPDQQAEEFATADGALVEALERLGDGLNDFHTVAFGFMEVDAAGFLGMRLSEHALHAWDVAVTFDAAAVVDSECVQLLIDRLPMAAGYMGKAERAGDERPFTAIVATTAPSRRFAIAVGDEVTMTPDTGGGPADLELPAEALLRLVYGRLDAAHAPTVPTAEAATLFRLRTVFTPD